MGSVTRLGDLLDFGKLFIAFVDVEGTKRMKQMITLLAITSQFIPQNRPRSEWQETDVREYMRSTDVNSVFSIFLTVFYSAKIVSKQRRK